jgi:branched-chain amino acid transport system substrate-binding protein
MQLGRSSRMRVSGAVGLAAALALCACGNESPSNTNSDYVIGFAIGKTGFMEGFDVPAMQAAQIAMKEINDKGGLLGRKLVAVSSDNHSDVNQSGTAGLDVISKGAKMVAVSCDYDMGGGAASQAHNKGLMVWSECAGSFKFGPQGVGPHAFTMGMAAAEEGSGLAEWAFNTKGLKTAFVMHEVVNAFNDESCNTFSNRFSQLAGASGVVGKADFKATDPSFNSQITQIRNLSKPPDAIFLCSFSPGMPKMIRAIRSAGINSVIIENQSAGGDAWKSAIPDISNMFYTDNFSINGDDPSPAINNLVTLWKQQNPNSVPIVDGHMPDGYGLIYVWAAAVQKANSFDPAKVSQVLESFTNEPTPIGPWTFTAQYHINLKREMRLMQIQGGKTTFLQTLVPSTLVTPTV